MKVIIDTSSWVALIRYYHPFDSKQILKNFFEKKLKDSSFILIDKVLEECKYQSQKIVVTEYTFTMDKDVVTSTTEILPYKRFFNALSNNWSNPLLRNRLLRDEGEEVFQSQIQEFVKGADAKLILTAKHFKDKGEDVLVVTEETTHSNDGKLFKKIPFICDNLNIGSCNVQELIKRFDTDLTIDIL